jgi:hypothetical protein
LARSGRWINLRVIGRERAAFHREAQPELPKPTIYPRQKCLAKASPKAQPKAHVSPGRGLISAWRGTAIRRAGSMACCRNSCSTRRVRLLGNALSAGKDRRYEPPVSFVPRPPISPRQRCLAWATPRQRCLAWATPVSQTKVPGLGNACLPDKGAWPGQRPGQRLGKTPADRLIACAGWDARHKRIRPRRRGLPPCPLDQLRQILPAGGLDAAR